MAQPQSVLVPWPFIGRLIVGAGVPVLLVALSFGSGAAGAMMLCGFMPVLGAMAMGRGAVAAAAPATLFSAILLMALQPLGWLVWAVAILFAFASGWEATRTGGRAFVFALYGWVAISTIPTIAAPVDVLPFVLAGMVVGWGVARWLGLKGQFSLPATGVPFGASLAAFLCVGLVITALFANWVEERYGYWVLLLFVLRALAPASGA